MHDHTCSHTDAIMAVRTKGHSDQVSEGVIAAQRVVGFDPAAARRTPHRDRSRPARRRRIVQAGVGLCDKKNMAMDIHELITSLGLGRISIVGHDIGLMIAYACAAEFPQATDRVVLMDVFLLGIGHWKDVWLMRDLWHFHFYGDVPLALVKGRERIYLEHFWNDFAADPKCLVSEADRRIYARAYAQPDGMRAGFEYFRNFERDAEDFAKMAQRDFPCRSSYYQVRKPAAPSLLSKPS